MDFKIDFLFDIFFYITSRIRYFFHLVNPTECMFENVENVPRYVEEVFYDRKISDSLSIVNFIMNLIMSI